MQLRTLLLTFILVCGVSLGAASHANADYTLWAPTTSNDQNVFSFNLTPQTCNMNADLYINAVGATQDTTTPGSYLLLQMVQGQTYSATDFTIQQVGGTGGNWFVYNANGQQVLSLGSTNQFGLYYYSGGVFDQPTITDQSGLPDQWLLNQGLCNPVLVVDAAPIPGTGNFPAPIPGTLLLLGPGLAGVFGFRRRFSS
jgi:hypothetical protein